MLSRIAPLPVLEATATFEVVLINPYELGRQPFALAQPAAWLKREGFAVSCVDLSLEKLDPEMLADAGLVAVYVGMHTATRIAVQALPHISRLAPKAHLCVYGLYAPMNEALLRGLGVGTVLGGEVELALVTLAKRLLANGTALTQRGTAMAQSEPVISLGKIPSEVPDRSGLPELSRYAHLVLPDGTTQVAGFAAAVRYLERDLAQANDWLTLGHRRSSSGRRSSIRPKPLAKRQQRELHLAAQHAAHAQSAQQRLVHGGVEPVDAEVGLRCQPTDVRQSLHRDAGRGMHAHINRDQARILQHFGIELLERQIDATHRKALALEPGGGLRQGKRLPPQFTGIDEDNLEGGRHFEHRQSRNRGQHGRRKPRARCSYFDFGRCSKGAEPGSRLAPASLRPSRYFSHNASRLLPSQNK